MHNEEDKSDEEEYESDDDEARDLEILNDPPKGDLRRLLDVVEQVQPLGGTGSSIWYSSYSPLDLRVRRCGIAGTTPWRYLVQAHVWLHGTLDVYGGTGTGSCVEGRVNSIDACCSQVNM